nr:MAG TPA: ERF superfamily protein [Caudoviricetes sp.]
MEKSNIYEAIASVQSALKAPKGQYNSFGKYAYRSCEDILEAVKPILKESGLFLQLSDEPVMVGDWHYIKATATVADFSGNQVLCTAYAREPAEKKGMDDSQITGTASSYARKYALNGLFCIDDTKDADTDSYQTQTAGKKTTAAKPATQKKAEQQPTPKQEAPAQEQRYICASCGKPLQAVNHKGNYFDAAHIAASTKNKFGRILCWTCAQKQPKEDGGLTHA